MRKQRRVFTNIDSFYHCLPKGKLRTSMAHELRNIPVDSHVTVPSDETITLVDI